ncbi:MAG: type II toxin-antitoxin system MqsA family antitoxin [Oscillospiraceae bacterium]|nr:type II toxin-antitoxin system MqsA family antitoxin [Oscillospiraceae bacterium]
MTCFFCKGDMEASTTTHVVELGDSVIVIRHVPCFRCKKCGEVVFTGTVVERLEQITAELKKSLEEVNVVSYTAA